MNISKTLLTVSRFRLFHRHKEIFFPLIRKSRALPLPLLTTEDIVGYIFLHRGKHWDDRNRNSDGNSRYSHHRYIYNISTNVMSLFCIKGCSLYSTILSFKFKYYISLKSSGYFFLYIYIILWRIAIWILSFGSQRVTVMIWFNFFFSYYKLQCDMYYRSCMFKEKMLVAS